VLQDVICTYQYKCNNGCPIRLIGELTTLPLIQTTQSSFEAGFSLCGVWIIENICGELIPNQYRSVYDGYSG